MARPLLFENAILIDPEAPTRRAGSLLVEDGRIAAILAAGADPPSQAERIDLAGGLLAPGLIEIHLHGRVVFASAANVEGALRQDSASCARHGVTAFLATTVASEAHRLRERVDRLVRASRCADWPGALPVGIHLEGPWINPRAAGAQPRAGIRAFDPVEGRELLERGGGWIRMVTLAPEMPGAGMLLAEISSRGGVGALGHSLATAEQVREAMTQGARHVTHLFNAMGPLHQRTPGLVAAALAEEGLTCDLICDGAHVHPDWVRVAARAKAAGLLLISDRVDPPTGGGTGSGTDWFGSGSLRDDGVALRLPDGRLAGSRLTLDRAVCNVQAWGALTLEEAVAACTLRPARLLGMEAERGTLRPGGRADLVVLDAGGPVRETWVGGRRVHPA